MQRTNFRSLFFFTEFPIGEDFTKKGDLLSCYLGYDDELSYRLFGYEANIGNIIQDPISAESLSSSDAISDRVRIFRFFKQP